MLCSTYCMSTLCTWYASSRTVFWNTAHVHADPYSLQLCSKKLVHVATFLHVHGKEIFLFGHVHICITCSKCMRKDITSTCNVVLYNWLQASCLTICWRTSNPLHRHTLWRLDRVWTCLHYSNGQRWKTEIDAWVLLHGEISCIQNCTLHVVLPHLLQRHNCST